MQPVATAPQAPATAPAVLVEHLFRHESGRMVGALTKLFGFDKLEAAEDIVQDTFVQAVEAWGTRGLPDNPTAWLYKVAKNNALNYVNRQATFAKVAAHLRQSLPEAYTTHSQIELAFVAINDSQLQMLFAVCHPAIAPDAQVALALKTLCGFSIGEVAHGLLATPANIEKRLYRAKQKLRAQGLSLDFPAADALPA